MAKISRFPNLGDGRIKLVFFDQNFTDCFIRQSRTHLALKSRGEITKDLARISTTQERNFFFVLISVRFGRRLLLVLALILVMEGEFHVEAICFFQIVTVLTCLVSRERKRIRWTRKILSSRPKLGKRTQGFFHTEIINHRVLHNMTAKWLKKNMIVCFAKIWRPPRTSRRLKTAKIWQVFQIGGTLLVDRFFTKQTIKSSSATRAKAFSDASVVCYSIKSYMYNQNF